MGSNFVEGEVGLIQVFRVEMGFIFAMEWKKKRWEVTLIEHWFGDKNQFGKILFRYMSQCLVAPRKTLYIPG